MTARSSAVATLRAAIYARVSTDEQAEKGYSLTEQRLCLEAYCEARGWQVVACLQDDITGSTRNRPGLLKVEEMAAAGEIDVVVCVRLDRLARIDHLRCWIEDDLKRQDVRVIYTEQSFEDTSSGRLQKGIMGKFYEYERDLIRERTIAGRTRKAKDAKVAPNHIRLYGYRQVTVAEAATRGIQSGTLEIVEEEAAVVREIFRLYAAGGISVRQLANRLNGQGIRTGRGLPWSGESVRGTLGNEAYAGVLWWGRHEWRMVDGRRTQRIRPRDEWLAIPCAAIVDRQTWEIVQQRLRHNARAHSGRPSGRYPLSGYIWCGSCETQDGARRRAVGATGGTPPTRRYVCGTGNPWMLTPYCGCSVLAEKAEQAVWEKADEVSRPGVLAYLLQTGAEETRRQIGSPEDELRELDSRIKETYRDEEKVMELAFEFSREVWEPKKQAILTRRTSLLARKAELEALAAAAIDPKRAARIGDEIAAVIRARVDASRGDISGLRPALKYFEIIIQEGRTVRIELTGASRSIWQFLDALRPAGPGL